MCDENTVFNTYLTIHEPQQSASRHYHAYLVFWSQSYHKRFSFCRILKFKSSFDIYIYFSIYILRNCILHTFNRRQCSQTCSTATIESSLAALSGYILRQARVRSRLLLENNIYLIWNIGSNTIQHFLSPQKIVSKFDNFAYSGC